MTLGSDFAMGKNKDRSKKSTSVVQKPATKAKTKIEKELKKQIERLGEVFWRRSISINEHCHSLFFLRKTLNS